MQIPSTIRKFESESFLMDLLKRITRLVDFLNINAKTQSFSTFQSFQSFLNYSFKLQIIFNTADTRLNQCHNINAHQYSSTMLYIQYLARSI